MTGTNVVQLAQLLLVEQGGWPGLQRADFGALRERHGMGEATTATLKAALEIGRRLLLTKHEQRFQIKSPSDAANLLMLEMSHLDQEHLRTVLLDTKNEIVRPRVIIESDLQTRQLERTSYGRKPFCIRTCASAEWEHPRRLHHQVPLLLKDK